jgi:aspartokinase/homoserine dehydrogenase 1
MIAGGPLPGILPSAALGHPAHRDFIGRATNALDSRGLALYLSIAMNVFTSPIELVLLGARGQVGSALRRRLGRELPALQGRTGLDLRLVAACDRRGFAFDLDGLAPDTLEAALRPREPGDLERVFARTPRAAPMLLVDCTASDEVADRYLPLLEAGIGVVGANKRANSRCFASWQRLQKAAREHGAPYRYETTAGAAIPLLGPLRDLRLRGERVHDLRGVLSGSLSYLLHRLHEGCAFSAAVEEARALGYTEPDPLDDLRATDLSRKLLVLARECGFALEPEGLRVEPLFAPLAGDARELAPQLLEVDAAWCERVAAAESRAQRLVVLAEVDAEGGRIGVREVPCASEFGRLRPGQNLVCVRTELQDATPLSLGGPGAGAEVTAAGVFSDVLAAAAELATQRYPSQSSARITLR